MSSEKKVDRGLKSTEEAHASRAGVAPMNGPPRLRLGGLGTPESCFAAANPRHDHGLQR